MAGSNAAAAIKAKSVRARRLEDLEEILRSIEPSELMATVAQPVSFIGTDGNYTLSVTPTYKGSRPARIVAMNLYGFILRALKEAADKAISDGSGGTLDWHTASSGVDITYRTQDLTQRVVVVTEAPEQREVYRVQVTPLLQRIGPYKLADVINSWGLKLIANCKDI